VAAPAGTVEDQQQGAGAKPGRPRDPRRGDAILDAVVGLLREAGAGAGRIGMREVAERSGTSLATIYRRWPSREDMLLDAIAHFIEEDAPVPDTGDLRTDLLAALETMRRRRRAFIESLPGLIAEGAANPDFGAAVRNRLLGRAGQALREVLQRARGDGQLPAGADLDLAADAALALFALQPIVYGRAPTRAYVTRIVDHALMPMLGLGTATTGQDAAKPPPP
jgi:AcrR family transcriptional regulator